MAYTALERSDNARVRKFAPCANLTNLKEAIVSKKENITNSERTGKKDNVSDTVNFAPKGKKIASRIEKAYVEHLNNHKCLNFFYIFVDFYGYFAVYV